MTQTCRELKIDYFGQFTKWIVSETPTPTHTHNHTHTHAYTQKHTQIPLTRCDPTVVVSGYTSRRSITLLGYRWDPCGNPSQLPCTLSPLDTHRPSSSIDWVPHPPECRPRISGLVLVQLTVRLNCHILPHVTVPFS